MTGVFSSFFFFFVVGGGVSWFNIPLSTVNSHTDVRGEEERWRQINNHVFLCAQCKALISDECVHAKEQLKHFQALSMETQTQSVRDPRTSHQAPGPDANRLIQ